MEKVVAYRSSDGKFFLSREECRRHETRNDIVCFNSKGEKTDDVDEACFIYLENDEASDSFNEEYGYHTIGLGWYMWSSWREDFLYWREIAELYEEGVDVIQNIKANFEEGDEY